MKLGPVIRERASGHTGRYFAPSIRSAAFSAIITAGA
ncbi:uncharacterized protein METZ01_LOCUS498730, partial [marine metagenome]